MVKRNRSGAVLSLSRVGRFFLDERFWITLMAFALNELMHRLATYPHVVQFWMNGLRGKPVVNDNANTLHKLSTFTRVSLLPVAQRPI